MQSIELHTGPNVLLEQGAHSDSKADCSHAQGTDVDDDRWPGTTYCFGIVASLFAVRLQRWQGRVDREAHDAPRQRRARTLLIATAVPLEVGCRFLVLAIPLRVNCQISQCKNS